MGDWSTSVPGDVTSNPDTLSPQRICYDSMKFKVADLMFDVPKELYTEYNPEAVAARTLWPKCSYFVSNIFTFLN